MAENHSEKFKNHVGKTELTTILHAPIKKGNSSDLLKLAFVEKL